MSYARAHGLHVIVPRFFIHLAPRGVESLALHDFARQITMVERGLLSPPFLRRAQNISKSQGEFPEKMFNNGNM